VNLPVVFLTSHAPLANEQLAFERGALDFIDKTRGVGFLAMRLSRVSELAKSAATANADKPIVCGKLVLRPASHRAYWNEVDVGLTVAEYNIVRLLVSNVGRYRSYRAIYDLQYYEGFVAGPGNHGYRTNVRATIKRIRRKFRELDPTFNEIMNSHAFGYCWEGSAAPN
jgi:two-component system, OmpR family, response regulator ChvI